MEYSKATEDLIKRIERINLRQEYIFNKRKIESLITKTYKYLNLESPKIIWCKDITDENFAGAAWATGVAWAARAAWAAGAARAAWAVGAAGAVGAWAAWAARAASIDYDFDYLILEHEFLQTEKGNESDKKALRTFLLFLKLKEAGLGYFAEQDGKLYCCPNPIIQMENLKFHSTTKPAIAWKDGLECYFLYGVYFEYALWEKVVNRELSFKEIIALENIEQRMAVIKIYGMENILNECDAKLLDKVRGYELYLVDNIFRIPAYYLKYKDPSTDRWYVSGIDPEVGKKNSAIDALKWKFYLEDQEGDELFAQES